MKTAYITHNNSLKHDNGKTHPESPDRLIAIDKLLHDSGMYSELQCHEAPQATREQLLRAHSADYLDYLQANTPAQSELFYLDPDTRLSHYSLEAAKTAAGAVILATDLLINGQARNAFCAIRPPGHHAKREKGMGFCIFNNIMTGVYHALANGFDRVALLDFDVHHGNGSESIINKDKRILFCSTFQHPFYPGEAFANESQIICSPLKAGDSGKQFRDIVMDKWLPALEQFKPQFIFVSAGFDAHRDDYLGGLNFIEEDYRWVSEKIVEIANSYAHGRIVSSLEGGYNCEALAKSVQAHLEVLLASAAKN